MTGRGPGGMPKAGKSSATKRKTPAPSDDEEGPATEFEKVMKRQRVLEGMEEEYVCPISQELFIDPVTAEDGRVYERDKIGRWFQECENEQTTSPVTNESMGFQLFPAHLVKSTLARLVAEGAIVGSLVDTWKATMAKLEEERQKLADIKSRAESGEVDAMAELGVSYGKGWLGLDKDAALSHKWNERAAREGHATAACRTGIMYLKGKGVAQNDRRGCEFMFTAAVLGSEHACEFIGYCHANGLHDYAHNDEPARYWFNKMTTCKYKDSVESTRARAKRWLEQDERRDDGSARTEDDGATDTSSESGSDSEVDNEVEQSADEQVVVLETDAEEEDEDEPAIPELADAPPEVRQPPLADIDAVEEEE